LTEKLLGAINSGKYDTIICNYPNGDMVGHTGVYEAAISAVEALDNCVAQVVSAVEKVGGQLMITADHGNAEQMRDPATGQAHTAHTSLPVPLIYIGSRQVKAIEGGKMTFAIVIALAHINHNGIFFVDKAGCFSAGDNFHLGGQAFEGHEEYGGQ
jgi:2,3-bisphosphoglycerate-independent phosphoglycerate mutase